MEETGSKLLCLSSEKYAISSTALTTLPGAPNVAMNFTMCVSCCGLTGSACFVLWSMTLLIAFFISLVQYVSKTSALPSFVSSQVRSALMWLCTVDGALKVDCRCMMYESISYSQGLAGLALCARMNVKNLFSCVALFFHVPCANVCLKASSSLS